MMRQGPLISSYRQDGDWFLVDLNLKNLPQIYNSFDPSPFRERDLDDDAAEYIEEAMKELSKHPRVKLLIHFQEQASETDLLQLTEAVHNYFAYRARVTRLELKEKLRFGRISLLIGLLFLAFCFEISALLKGNSGTFSQIVWEGLIIIGWVTLWRPLEIFLYEWWPLLGTIRLYERLQTIPVDFQTS
jgi:hypothetical protein